MKINGWLSLFTVLVLAGCAAGGGTTSTGPGDDDDDSTPNPTNTASPEPTGTAAPATKRCFIEWASQGTTAAKYHLYVVDIPLEEFTSGAKTYSDTIDGVLVWDMDEQGAAAAEVFAAEGSFAITVSGTNVGDTVTFDDDDGQSYDTDTQTGAANGGTGTFNGKIADLDAEEPELGSGSITINYGGQNRTLGDLGAIAGCYEDTGTEEAP